MFFLLGLIAGIVKSDLEIPKAAYDVLSLLLMLTIGLKGGMALFGTLGWHLLPEILGIACLGFIIPAILFPVLRKFVKLSLADSASFAAHYGSVSAGTFLLHSLMRNQTRCLSVYRLPCIWCCLSCQR